MTEERLPLAELLAKAGDGDFLRSVAEAVVQLLMETDVEGLIGAGRHERTADRQTYRNGYRDRVLDTRLGSLQLRIPKLLYARVSGDGQARGNTVASQIAALRERAAADGAAVGPDHAYVDEGRSGATLARPALERLRDAVAAGEVDRVYVHAPDRLARRYAYQVLLVEEFRRAGVEVVFLNRAIGGSAEDDLLLQVQGVIAEYERARILERSRRGRRHAALSGAVSAMCSAPYGYRYLGRHAAGGTARVEVVEDEARVVRQVFAWVGVERVSLREVGRRLQHAGCPTRTGLGHWDATTLCGMLRNPTYRGTAMFGRTRAVPPAPARLRPIRGRPYPPRNAAGSSTAVPREEWIAIPVPAIVDAGVFEAVQAHPAAVQLCTAAPPRPDYPAAVSVAHFGSAALS